MKLDVGKLLPGAGKRFANSLAPMTLMLLICRLDHWISRVSPGPCLKHLETAMLKHEGHLWFIRIDDIDSCQILRDTLGRAYGSSSHGGPDLLHVDHFEHGT